MNKYELALVVSAKVEDEVRNATVEKAKEYITSLGGTITNVDEWGKKKLAYEIQKMGEGFYYFIQFDAEPSAPAELEQREDRRQFGAVSRPFSRCVFFWTWHCIRTKPPGTRGNRKPVCIGRSIF